MKRQAIAAVIAATLLLTGCSAAAADEASRTAAPQSSATTEPLVAETPTVTTPEAQFLTYVRENLPATTIIPNATDEQLITAGNAGCALIADGVNPDDMTVIEGEQRSELGYFNDSSVIITGANMFLCG